MKDTQRIAMQQALDALEYAHATNQYESDRQDRAIKGLRAALAEPAVVRFGTEQQRMTRLKELTRHPAEPAVEPTTRIALNDGKYLSLEPCYFLGPVKWALYTENGKQIRFLDEYESEFVNAALKASPQPPAEVPLLTRDEIWGIWNMEIGVDEMDQHEAFKFARYIEQAVRQKAGLKL